MAKTIKLSKAQENAIKTAARHLKNSERYISTLDIAGNTGKSLWKMGLFIRHPNENDDISAWTYELSDAGEAYAREKAWL